MVKFPDFRFLNNNLIKEVCSVQVVNYKIEDTITFAVMCGFSVRTCEGACQNTNSAMELVHRPIIRELNDD